MSIATSRSAAIRRGIFYIWDVRSTGSDDPADIELEPWKGTSFICIVGGRTTSGNFSS